MKLKVLEGTWTVWSQETKQLNVELEDGRILGVRQIEEIFAAELTENVKKVWEKV